MNNLKYFLAKNKIIVIIATILFICAIAIAIGVYAQITNRKVIDKDKKVGELIDYEELENNFDEMFDNTIKLSETANQDINYDEIIYCAYDIRKFDSCKLKKSM